jgi:hypothetical protein
MLKRLREAGERERAKLSAEGAALSPWRMLGVWFGFFRPSRLLKLLGSALLLLAIVYVIEFRAAREAAEAQAGANATTARIGALTVERLALSRCSGLSRSCGVLPGKQTLYVYFGTFGTVAIFVVAGAGLYLVGWGLGRVRAARSA